MKSCNEPALYKMIFVGYEPYTDIWAYRYCKHHYEFMAGIVKSQGNSSELKERRRVARMMEMNNWFQHE